jgi:hypothetical protein
VSKGFLHREYRNGILAATVSYPVGSDRFKQIERLIEQQNPKTFAELRDFLL